MKRCLILLVLVVCSVQFYSQIDTQLYGKWICKTKNADKPEYLTLNSDNSFIWNLNRSYQWVDEGNWTVIKNRIRLKFTSTTCKNKRLSDDIVFKIREDKNNQITLRIKRRHRFKFPFHGLFQFRPIDYVKIK